MKLFKKFIVAALIAVMVFSFAGCHKKDEVALNIDGIDITSALYMYTLIESDLEAKQKVDANHADDKDKSDIDYYSEQIDGVNFVEYVKADAIKRCKKIALYQKLLDQKLITITDEEKKEAETYAENYWAYYGYSSVFEPNGVSLNTFKKAFLASNYADLHFKSIYGKDGEKEVSNDTLVKTLNDKYILVYTLTEQYAEKATDEEKAALKNKYQGYADRLKKGEAYQTIYEEINGKSETSESTTESTEGAPKDKYATVIGAEDTSYASDDYNDIDALSVNEVKLIENSEKTGFTVYKKLDINADPYYLDALTDDMLYLLKTDEYEETVNGLIKDMQVEENTYATKRFKVKKIIYPEA